MRSPAQQGACCDAGVGHCAACDGNLCSELSIAQRGQQGRHCRNGIADYHSWPAEHRHTLWCASRAPVAKCTVQYNVLEQHLACVQGKDLVRTQLGRVPLCRLSQRSLRV